MTCCDGEHVDELEHEEFGKCASKVGYADTISETFWFERRLKLTLLVGSYKSLHIPDLRFWRGRQIQQQT